MISEQQKVKDQKVLGKTKGGERRSLKSLWNEWKVWRRSEAAARGVVEQGGLVRMRGVTKYNSTHVTKKTRSSS